jgi:hypothetical protein
MLQPRPSQNLPIVSLLEPGIPDYGFLWVFTKHKQILPDVGNSVKDDSSAHITRTFPVV